MTDRTITLIGGPDSGKTNYLARVWEALRLGRGMLRASGLPTNIEYVEEALAHLLQGRFAPRSDTGIDHTGQNLRIPVTLAKNPGDGVVNVMAPDATGELWKKAVETCELPEVWMTQLEGAFGALMFVRVGSDQNVAPLDWVTAAGLLRIMPPPSVDGSAAPQIPTQVALCELLRFLERSLSKDTHSGLPRIAVLVTAWDRVDAQTANAGPRAYLEKEYPLFAGRLRDADNVAVRIFGVSVVGGDFVDPKFRDEFLAKGLGAAGYVVEDENGDIQVKNDLTLPIAWVVDGISSSS